MIPGSSRYLHNIYVSLLSLAFSWLGASGAFGQDASIAGQVKDKETGEALIGVNVIVEGTTQGTSTDLNGRFRFNYAQGIHRLKVSAIGYNDLIVEDTRFSADEETFVVVQLVPSIESLEAVVVEARGDKANGNILLLERKNASLAVENIGARELSEKGFSDVESGLTNISGIAKASRGLFVRGLGDRYNNAYLNGLPLPSANPDKKVFELDLLPVSIVRNIDVTKFYNVDQFADVSGASIAIFTRAPLGEDFIQLHLGAGFNSQSTFKDFQTSRDGDFEYLGFSGGGRASPVAVDGRDFALRLPSEMGSPFQTGFDVAQIEAPLDHNWGLDLDKNWNIGSGRLGMVFSSSYRNAYRNDRGINDVLDANQAPINAFDRRRYLFETNLTSLVGFSYEKDERNTFNLNYIFSNNSENSYILSQGRTIDFDNVRRLRNRYLEKRLSTLQATSDHEIIASRLFLNWGASVSRAFTDEPDRRDLTFFALPGSDLGTINRNVAAENGRYFQEIDEQENNLFGELKYNFGKVRRGSTSDRWVFGYQFKEKARAIDFRTFTLINDGLATTDIDLSNLDELYSDANLLAGDFSYRDTNGGERQSRALRRIHGAYSYVQWSPVRGVEVIPGVRVESTDQTVFFRLLGTPLQNPFRTSVFDKINFLPSLNVKYAFKGNQLLRAGVSRTLTRPNFNELIPAPQVNENLQSVVGRPTLENSQIMNLDVRYEHFPGSGELFSVGIFYKHIDKPIEQVRSGENFISFFNVSSATVYGLEFGFQRRLSNIFESALFNDFIFDGNISLLATQVNTDPDNVEDPETRALLANVTNTSRGLQGASPYILNLALGYDRRLFRFSESSTLKLTYNISGRRIINVGTQQRGDEFELPYGRLNLIWKSEFVGGWSVGLSLSNLLNPRIEREQAAGPLATEGRITQSFREGRDIGISVSYRLNLNDRGR